MENKTVQFDSQHMSVRAMEMMMEYMPVGFFVYRADETEHFLYVNSTVVSMLGCDTREEFLERTGGSFRGFVYSENLDGIEESICRQISDNVHGIDVVEYRIRRTDGEFRWIKDYGRSVQTTDEGLVFYVFIFDETEKHRIHQQMIGQYRRSEEETSYPKSQSLRKRKKPDGIKKNILVVEDSEMNREILIELLKDEYNILTAENGAEGIRILKAHRANLSLVLLDVYMPVCNGFEFLEQTQSDPFLASVPIIVTTGSASHEDEEKCLQLGATDFVTKPYNVETMLGRIHNVIRLRESISELSIVEFDKLTGLYTMPAFLHHAEQILSETEEEYDLGVLSIKDFSFINRVYGEKKGDEVLRYITELSKKLLPNTLFARNRDHFYMLRRSADNAKALTRDVHDINPDLSGPVPNLRIRQGLYVNVDKTKPISVLCDRAKMAVDSIKSGQSISFAYYDPSMEKKRMEEEKLLLAFTSAIDNHEFVIWIQPKVDIRTGQIVAGEALVRWIDREGNFISPGAFIPLYEREGQIQKLDEYIFRTVCEYQRRLKKAGKRIVPISINLSRNSLFRKDIVNIYRQIAEEEQTELSLVPIEITESAATTEIEIMDICEAFVKEGFLLQMDDFGAGYSSLSALSALPFHVVKLDKSLVDQIGKDKGNIVIKNAIETAHELGMQVVAEGVEELFQVEYLALVECDQIQGYFYSPPKKTPFFEELLEKENPFADKGKIQNVHTDHIIGIRSSDLNRYLKVCKILFKAVRLLNDDCCEYCMANSDGTMNEKRSPCFEIWERKERCPNCISMKSMQSKQAEHKFEVFGEEVYSVYSAYLEVDGKPHVIELVNPIGDGLLYGYRRNLTLLEVLQKDNMELYLDIQLGTLNRRFFEECQDQLCQTSGLVMIDVDNFKEINDVYGHLVGDSVLQGIVNTIRNMIRENDFLIRIGRDELMICFVGMRADMLKDKLERIRCAVENEYIEENPYIHPTISVGGTSCLGYSEKVRKIADEALREAKKTKNTVIVK